MKKQANYNLITNFAHETFTAGFYEFYPFRFYDVATIMYTIMHKQSHSEQLSVHDIKKSNNSRLSRLTMRVS